MFVPFHALGVEDAVLKHQHYQLQFGHVHLSCCWRIT
jgi:hypothetical protein